MSSHDITVIIYALIATAGLVLEVIGRSGRTDIPRLGTVLTRIMHTRKGRIGVMAGWMWLGLHYFAR
jgi:hypothetical protein